MTWLCQNELQTYLNSCNISPFEKKLRYVLMKIVEYATFALAWSPFILSLIFYLCDLQTLYTISVAFNVINITTWIISNFRLIDSLKPRPVGSSVPNKKVAVIGCGPVGLVAVKELLEEGHQVKAFDFRPTFGGVFAFNPDLKLGCYDSCRLTSSPFVTAFSDFPPEFGDEIHWHNTEYIDYLKKYIDNFNLMPHLNFNTEVTSVYKCPESKKWMVKTKSADGTEECAEYDNVAVCAGLNHHGRLPCFEGINDFKGELVHVSEYNYPSQFKGKRVVILGIGESSSDVSAEIAYAADDAYIAARRGSFVIPRISPLTNRPNDYDSTRLRHSTSIFIRDFIMYFTRWLCWLSRNIDRSALIRLYILDKAGTGPVGQPATKSANFIDAISCGKLKIKPGISKFEGDNTVIFKDGSRVEADAIVFCTGYEPKFPYLQFPKGVTKMGISDLYRYMVHPELGTEVCFLGYARPTIGAIPPIGEMQSRWFAKLVSGSVKLPEATTMWKAIEQWKFDRQYVFPRSEKCKSITEYVPYMDAVAEDVGCRPHPWYILSRPTLFYKMMTGPTFGYHWRLTGPGASERAYKAVMSITRTHGLDELMLLLGFRLLVWPLEAFGFKPVESVSTAL